MVVANMDGPTRDQVLKLMQEKEKIESEISDLGHVLSTNNVGLTDTLVDENGFPRNDIDVYQVRHARHRIICLQNDHKAIMKQIELGLHALHSGAANVDMDAAPSPAPLTNGHLAAAEAAERITAMHVTEPQPLQAIAKVNFVNPGSPAEDAGIMVDDEILEFGSVNGSNFRELAQIGEVVQHSVNARVNVKLMRGLEQRILEVPLTPRQWAGRGLLGCNIIPMEKI